MRILNLKTIKKLVIVLSIANLIFVALALYQKQDLLPILGISCLIEISLLTLYGAVAIYFYWLHEQIENVRNEQENRINLLLENVTQQLGNLAQQSHSEYIELKKISEILLADNQHLKTSNAEINDQLTTGINLQQNIKEEHLAKMSELFQLHQAQLDHLQLNKDIQLNHGELLSGLAAHFTSLEKIVNENKSEQDRSFEGLNGEIKNLNAEILSFHREKLNRLNTLDDSLENSFLKIQAESLAQNNKITTLVQQLEALYLSHHLENRDALEHHQQALSNLMNQIQKDLVQNIIQENSTVAKNIDLNSAMVEQMSQNLVTQLNSLQSITKNNRELIENQPKEINLLTSSLEREIKNQIKLLANDNLLLFNDIDEKLSTELNVVQNKAATIIDRMQTFPAALLEHKEELEFSMAQQFEVLEKVISTTQDNMSQQIDKLDTKTLLNEKLDFLKQIIEINKSDVLTKLDELAASSNLQALEAIETQQKLIATVSEEQKISVDKRIKLLERYKDETMASITNMRNNLSSRIEWNYDRLDALMSIHATLSIEKPLPIMNGWAVSSDIACEIVRIILNSPDGFVIDIGTGISTILGGYALKKKQSKAKIIAIEHDLKYYNQTLEEVKHHGLEAYINLIHCPLVSHKINGKSWLWYDISQLNLPENIILISVDGPPGATQKHARYPAIPLLKKVISKNTVILLDDARRQEEQEIADFWIKELGLRSRYFKTHKDFIKLKL